MKKALTCYIPANVTKVNKRFLDLTDEIKGIQILCLSQAVMWGLIF